MTASATFTFVDQPGVDLRVLARRRRVRGLHLAASSSPTCRTASTCSASARPTPSASSRARPPSTPGRSPCPTRRRPRRRSTPDRRPRRRARPRSSPSRPSELDADLRVLARRRRLRGLRLAAPADRPAGRRAHAPGPGRRPGRERRPDARELPVDRHRAAGGQHPGGQRRVRHGRGRGRHERHRDLRRRHRGRGHLDRRARPARPRSRPATSPPAPRTTTSARRPPTRPRSTVCLEYAPASIPEPVRLLHFEGGVWVDVTTSADPVAGVICGVVDSLSPFAIATGTAAVVPETTIGDRPARDDRQHVCGLRLLLERPARDLRVLARRPDSTGDRARRPPPSPAWPSATTSSSSAPRTPPGSSTRRRPATSGRSCRCPRRRSSSGPEAATESTTATFTFTSDQPGATFECLLDDAPAFTPCASRHHVHRPGARRARLPRPRGRRGRQRRPDPGRVQLGDRGHPAGGHDRVGPGRDDREHQRRRSPSRRPRAGLAFECALDGGACVAVHLAEELQRPRARRAHVPGARLQPGRDRRRRRSQATPGRSST